MFNLKIPRNWHRLLSETPEPFRKTYILTFSRIWGYCSLFVSFLCLIWYLFVPWEGGLASIVAFLLSGLFVLIVRSQIDKNVNFAGVIFYLIINVSISFNFWETAYFISYLAFSVTCIGALLIFGRLIALLTLILYMGQSFLYTIILERGITTPDGHFTKVDPLTLLLWWTAIALILLFASTIYKDLVKDNLQLRHSEATLSLAQQVGNIGSYLFDIATNQVTWSDEMFRINGFEPGEITPTLETGLSFIYPDDRGVLRKASNEAITTGQGQCEVRITTEKDNLRYLLVKLSLINDASNKPISILGTVLDITERKLEEVKARQQFYHAQVLAELSQLFTEVSQDYSQLLMTIVERVSGITGAICGIQLLSPDETELDFVEVYHPNQVVREVMQEVLSATVPVTDQKGIAFQVLKTGKVVVLNPASTPEPLGVFKSKQLHSKNEVAVYSRVMLPLRAQNRVFGVIGLAHLEPTHYFNTDEVKFIQDVADRAALAITSSRLYSNLQQELAERRRTETALRESEERYRAILEYASDFVFLFDPETMCVLETNPAFQQLLGYTPEEALNLTLYDIVTDDRETVAANLQKLKTERHLSIATGQFWCKNGTTVEIEVNSNLLLYGSREIVCAIGRDITERSRLEQQQRQGQKLQAIGQLAGGVAHDFNNILTVIINYSDMMSDVVAPENEFLVTGIDQIKKAGLRASALTKQLLAFSRQQAMNLEIVNLNTVIHNIVPMLQRLIGEDISLQTNLQADLGWIKADTGQLEQVIVNLVANSRDAMPGGGIITIESTNLTLSESYVHYHSETQIGNYIMLAISDTGVGMDESIQKHIFEPFFTTKEPGKGTGLGLATVHGIIKQFGGNIWAYSEPGHGTTFKIYLPREETANWNNTIEQNINPEGQYNETILLVEDDVLVRQATGLVLQRFGYCVLEADSETAISLFEQNSDEIDLLLTDIVMPGISGKELAEELVKRRPGLKVLYMSGYSDKQVIHQVQESHNVTFLQKPFTPTSLNTKIRSVLG